MSKSTGISFDPSVAIHLCTLALLRKSYTTRLGKVLNARKVVRYIQIENKIRAAIRFEMAAGIPLVPGVVGLRRGYGIRQIIVATSDSRFPAVTLAVAALYR